MAKGKISRLPREIREQLNRQLDDNVPGIRLVAWLNELPEVKALLAAEFDGAAINEQNLTGWKQRGYRDWVMEREAQALAQSLGREKEAERQPRPTGMTLEQLVMGVTARYAALVCEWQQAAEPVKRRKLRVVMQDTMRLQRCKQRAQASEPDQREIKPN